MTHKVALVTGSTSAIGAVLSEKLLAHGYDLILLNRNRAETLAQRENFQRRFPDRRIEIHTADLADIIAIREAAAAIASAHRRIDLAFLNAGVLATGSRKSVDGIELHFAVNCVAPWLLTQLIRPVLAEAEKASVVVSGSAARQMVRKLDVSALTTPQAAKGMNLYARSKLAITAAFAAMRADYSADGTDLQVVDLPPTRTEMAKSPALPLLFRLGRFLFKTPEEAAAQLIAAAGIEGSAPPHKSRRLPPPETQDALLGLLAKVTES